METFGKLQKSSNDDDDAEEEKVPICNEIFGTVHPPPPPPPPLESPKHSTSVEHNGIAVAVEDDNSGMDDISGVKPSSSALSSADIKEVSKNVVLVNASPTKVDEDEELLSGTATEPRTVPPSPPPTPSSEDTGENKDKDQVIIESSQLECEKEEETKEIIDDNESNELKSPVNNEIVNTNTGVNDIEEIIPVEKDESSSQQQQQPHLDDTFVKVEQIVYASEENVTKDNDSIIMKEVTESEDTFSQNEDSLMVKEEDADGGLWSAKDNLVETKESSAIITDVSPVPVESLTSDGEQNQNEAQELLKQETESETEVESEKKSNGRETDELIKDDDIDNQQQQIINSDVSNILVENEENELSVAVKDENHSSENVVILTDEHDEDLVDIAKEARVTTSHLMDDNQTTTDYEEKMVDDDGLRDSSGTVEHSEEPCSDTVGSDVLLEEPTPSDVAAAPTDVPEDVPGDLPSDKVAPDVSEDAPSGTVATDVSPDVTGGTVATDVCEDVPGGTVDTDVSPDVTGGTVAADVSEDVPGGMVATDVSEDGPSDKVATDLSEDVPSGTVTSASVSEETSDEIVATAEPSEVPPAVDFIEAEVIKDGDHDSGVDESTQGKQDDSPKKPVKSQDVEKTQVTEVKKKSSVTGSPARKLVSPSTSTESPARTPNKTSSSTSSKTSTHSSNEKKLPMNKIVVGVSASPNLKVVKSKIGSMANVKHKAGGGEVKLEKVKIDLSNVKAKIGSTDNIQHRPTGGDRKVITQKLEWKAQSKIGSLENATHKAGGGNKKIETQKLDFKEKAKPKVGSKDKVDHKPGGGTVQIEEHKLKFKESAKSKVGSLDNVKHKPGGGAVQIYDEKLYYKQQHSQHSSSSKKSSMTGSEEHLSDTQSHSPSPGSVETNQTSKSNGVLIGDDANRTEEDREVHSDAAAVAAAAPQVIH